MPEAHSSFRPLLYLLPVAVLLTVGGCMGRWELGDVWSFLHPRAEPPAPLAGPQPHDAGTLPPPGSSR